VHVPAGAPTKSPVLNYGVGYDAGNITSPRRGYIAWPSLDTRREFPTYSRYQVLKKARWLYANVGIARRIVNGLADFVGYLTPQQATSDRVWNRLAQEWFMNRYAFARSMDRSGRLTFKSWQLARTRQTLRDGDLLSVITETPETGLAQVLCYESHQIGDGSEAKRPENLNDGVFVNRFNAPVAFRLVDPADERKFTRVGAEDCIFSARYASLGNVRGVSALAASINDQIDITEIHADVKHGIKVANLLGFAITSKGVQGPTNPIGHTVNSTSTSSADGTTVNTEEIWAGGQVARLGADEDIKTLNDSRPHPNQQEFTKGVIQGIAWSLGLPMEALFYVSGITGPAVRFVMAQLQRWIENERLMLQAEVNRFYVAAISRALVRGELPYPDDPQWWRVNWIPQSDMTIDRGREGRLALEELRAGVSTLPDLWADKGADWQSKLDQQAAAVAYAKEKAEDLGVPLESFLPGLFTAPKAPNA
jgi:capsid protein